MCSSADECKGLRGCHVLASFYTFKWMPNLTPPDLVLILIFYGVYEGNRGEPSMCWVRSLSLCSIAWKILTLRCILENTPVFCFIFFLLSQHHSLNGCTIRYFLLAWVQHNDCLKEDLFSKKWFWVWYFDWSFSWSEAQYVLTQSHKLFPWRIPWDANPLGRFRFTCWISFSFPGGSSITSPNMLFETSVEPATRKLQTTT